MGTDTEESLVRLLEAYCDEHGLTPRSADEMILELPDGETVHRAWLTNFIERWDAVMDGPADNANPGPACGHSACRQNHIDTGFTGCVSPLEEACDLLRELIDIEGPQPGHVTWYRKVKAFLAGGAA